MPLIIRRATPNDASRIHGLINQFTEQKILLPRSVEFIAAHAGHFIVADEDGDLLGCVHLDEYSPSLSELRTLAVDQHAQGRGVGRALVHATEALAAKRGVATLFAVSDDEAFFNRFGFSRRHIPELDRERSEVSKYKGVFAKDLLV